MLAFSKTNENDLVAIWPPTQYQGRREPRVGPGTTQILRMSGFVRSKTSKKNATLFSGFSNELQKKKVFSEFKTVFLSKFR